MPNDSFIFQIQKFSGNVIKLEIGIQMLPEIVIQLKYDLNAMLPKTLCTPFRHFVSHFPLTNPSFL